MRFWGILVPLLGMAALFHGDRAGAATYNVTTTADTGAVGSLRWAITQANASAGVDDTIQFQADLTGTITLGSELPVIVDSVDIQGPTSGSVTVSGDDTYRVLFVHTTDADGNVDQDKTVSISDLTIANGRAKGGDGGSGVRGSVGGGGGGAGLGGGLLVTAGKVTVTDVVFNNNNATGGDGGICDYYAPTGGGGGGGGLGGDGAETEHGLSGGGGGGGIGVDAGGGADAGTGGDGILSTGDSGGSARNGVSGGSQAGGGASSNFTYGGGYTRYGGGGGGDGGAASTDKNGGDGGFGGGGGGAAADAISPIGGDGGFGGGGGGGGYADGGDGGFGGGGGGGGLGAGAGGFGAGDGRAASSYYRGGGGLGAGGAVFVRDGASLTVNYTGDATAIQNSSVTRGESGGSGADPGQALGAGMFLGQDVTFNVDEGYTATVADDIGGATYDAETDGGVIKSGDGTLVLSGTNTYVGGTTISGGKLSVSADEQLGDTSGGVTFDGGALQYGAAFALDSGRTLTISDGGGGIDTAGQDITLSHVLSHDAGGAATDGGFTKSGNGTLILSGANTYTGGTTVSGGTLQLDGGDNRLATTGDVAVSSGAALDLNDRNQQVAALIGAGSVLLGDGGEALTVGSGSFSGVLSEDGALVKAGTGTLVLSGANTFTGGTTVSGGTLAGNTSSLQGSIANNANVEFNQTADGTYAGTMEGTGSLAKTGAAKLTLSGTNTYGGGTTVSGGTLAGNTSSLQGSIANNANVEFNQTADGTYAGTMEGTGSLAKTGAAKLTLSGTNTYGGGTTVSAGTLAGNTSSLQGSIANNANVEFNQTADGTYAGAMEGTGSLAKTGAAKLTLSGTNTYGGGTTVSAGTLAGNTSSLQGSIANNANVEFNQTADGTYAGAMEGTGSLAKTGAAKLTLSGTNTYGGGTTVSAGTLAGNTSSLQGDIVNNAIVEFNQASTGTYTGQMSGTGSLVKTGSGTLTLRGSIGHNGGTTISAGTLAVDTNFSSTGLSMANGSELQVVGGTTTWNAGDLQTGQTLTVDGGTLDLNQDFNRTGTPAGTFNFHSGTIEVSGGTTQWNDVAVTNGKTVTVDGGTWNTNTLSFTQGNAGTVNLQSGTLTVAGDADFSDGTFTFTGGTLNVGGTLVGVTTVAAGQTVNLTAASGQWSQANLVVDGDLGVGADGTLNLTGALTANGNVEVAGDATVGGLAIGNSGALTLSGGTLTLTGDTDFSAQAGTFTHTAGEIEVTDGTTTWNAGSDGLSATKRLTLDGGTLEIVGVDFDTTQNGFTATSGCFEVDGGGTLTGNTSTLNDLNIANRGVVAMDQGTDGTYTGEISGDGSLTKTGSGRLTLSGDNSYSGGTTVSAGTLVGNTTSLQGDIVNNAIVEFNQIVDGTYTGDMSGSGSLLKTGDGTLSWSGNLTCLGTTEISAGFLLLNGNLSSNCTIDSGARLGGNGTVGDLNNQGIVAPGNSIGTTTVTGDYAHNASATYEVEINDAGQSDLIDVAGTATIHGGTVDVQPEAGTYTPGMSYTILEADGGVTGMFDSLTGSVIGSRLQLIYNPKDVQLYLAPLYIGVAQTSNQQVVAIVLEQMALAPTGDVAAVLGQLDTVINNPGGAAYLGQFGGEVFGSAASVGIQNTSLFFGAISRRLRTMDAFLATGKSRPRTATRSTVIRGQSPSWLASTTATWRPWYQGYGVSGNANGDGNAAGFHYSIGGTTVAVDRALDDHTRFGLVGGYSNSNIRLSGPNQRTLVDSGQFALYLQRYCCCRYTTGIFSYGHNDYDSSRQLAFGNINRTASADHHGDEFAFYVEHGRLFRLGGFQFQPYGALQYINLHQSPFSETGADSMNLAVEGLQAHSFTGQLGGRLTWYKKLGGGRTLAPELRALWRHEFLNENRLVNASFAGAPGSSFAVSGADLGRDAAILGTGCNIYLGNRISLFANYDLLMNNAQVAHAGTGGLQVLW